MCSRRQLVRPRSLQISPKSIRGADQTGTASTQVLAAATSLAEDSNRLKLEVQRFLATVAAA